MADKPTLKELKDAIDKLLDHPLGKAQFDLGQTKGNLAPKAYEAYVFGLCLRAAREMQGNPRLEGNCGPPNPFRFRGAPGEIHSTSKNFGYASFELKNQAFEIHAGIEFEGASAMLHELDVSIITGKAAEKCRLKPANPKGASLVVALECKFFENDLNKSTGRAFVGLMADMGSSTRFSSLCSNRDKEELRQYFRPKNRPVPTFQLTPLKDHESTVTRFVEQIKAALGKLAGM